MKKYRKFFRQNHFRQNHFLRKKFNVRKREDISQYKIIFDRIILGRAE